MYKLWNKSILYIQKSLANTGANRIVNKPHKTSAKLLIAASISPISIALAVPIACDEDPMAMPLAIEDRM